MAVMWLLMTNKLGEVVMKGNCIIIPKGWFYYRNTVDRGEGYMLFSKTRKEQFLK